MRPWYIGCASGFHPDEASSNLAGRSNTNPSLVLGFIFWYTKRMKNLTHEEILKWIGTNRDEMSEKWRDHCFIVEERKGHPGFYYAVHHFVTRNFNEARSAMWFGDRELERAYGKKSRASGNWADYANVALQVQPRTWLPLHDAGNPERFNGGRENICWRSCH